MRKVEIAKALGRKAQQSGMERFCKNDHEFQTMLTNAGSRVVLMKAWYIGYDEAAGPAPMPDDELAERITKAKAAGKAAFEAGKIRTPALDANLDPLLRNCQPGEGIKVLNAWLRAFDDANLGVRP